MAQAWYLLKSPYSQLSGFESEISDSYSEGFAEALNSSIAVDIEILNYDMTQCTPLRAIVQNNVQDTKLKTLNRQILVPIGTCKAGMYVKYKDRYWLIVGLVDDNTIYEKAIMTICNYLLTWMNNSRQIVQRWVNVSSASQYNHGETNTENYAVRSDQLMVLTPDDDECMTLDQGKRFIIDRRCKVYERQFDSSVQKDTSNPVISYRLTRADSVLYNYQDSGHYEFMAYQDEQGDQDGYYVVRGKGYWLCEEPMNDKMSLLSCSIECESPEIYDGLEAGEFTAKFYNSMGAEVVAAPQWEIRCDFVDSLNVSYVDNTILISVDNSKLINKSFELSLSGDGYKPTTITVTIRAFL